MKTTTIKNRLSIKSEIDKYTKEIVRISSILDGQRKNMFNIPVNKLEILVSENIAKRQALYTELSQIA